MNPEWEKTRDNGAPVEWERRLGKVQYSAKYSF
jgi:hypothetical protein